jgi:hypothetical protein
MPDPAPVTTTDQGQIASEDTRDIRFRPVAVPGPIVVYSAPSPVPTKTQSELGRLGTVTLVRPGGGAPAATASAKIGSTALGLMYTTTAADLAAPGDWICRIFNASLVSPTFATKITSSASPPVIDYPIKTASFDIPLLGTLLMEAVETAAVRIHLEASGDGSNQSVASWSVPIANLIGGSTEHRFHIDDASKYGATFRLLGLNSDPAGPTIYISTNPLAIVLTLGFDTQGAVLQSQTTGVPDGTIDWFEVALTVNFDGTIVPECDVKATIDVIDYDVSSDIKSKVESQISDMIFNNDLAPPWVIGYLEKFFVQLMRLTTRLEQQRGLPMLGVGHVKNYAAQGNSLIVSYYQVPQSLITTNR